MRQVKVLLVQLASMGDCLFVTTLAKQIKENDYPNCHLSWLITSKYLPAILNNPYVDQVIEIPLASVNDIQKQRNQIDKHIKDIDGYAKFDHIFITDYTKFNKKYWYGTTRSSLLRSYPFKLKNSPEPLVYLTNDEVKKVEFFCTENNINTDTFNILFECSPQSEQSLMTLETALNISKKIVNENNKIKIILSSNQTFLSGNLNIIDGSKLSWRENAELANYCNLMVGCSSGISWLCTSNWVKPLPFIQIVNPNYESGNFSASMKIDFRYFGISTENIIELYNPTDSIVESCIVASSKNKFKEIKNKYDINDNSYFCNLKFLSEANISVYEKISIISIYFIPVLINKFFKNIKIYLAYSKRLNNSIINFFRTKVR